MPDFPLYTELFTRASNDPTPFDLRRISSIIKTITSNHSNEDRDKHYSCISALILHHYCINEATSATKLPSSIYGINLGTKGVVVDMTKLPESLQAVLAQYVKYCEEL